METNGQMNLRINAILVILVLISTGLYFYLVAVKWDILHVFALASFTNSYDIRGFAAAISYLLFPVTIAVLVYRKSRFKMVAILLGLLNIHLAGFILVVHWVTQGV